MASGIGSMGSASWPVRLGEEGAWLGCLLLYLIIRHHVYRWLSFLDRQWWTGGSVQWWWQTAVPMTSSHHYRNCGIYHNGGRRWSFGYHIDDDGFCLTSFPPLWWSGRGEATVQWLTRGTETLCQRVFFWRRWVFWVSSFISRSESEPNFRLNPILQKMPWFIFYYNKVPAIF